MSYLINGGDAIRTFTFEVVAKSLVLAYWAFNFAKKIEINGFTNVYVMNCSSRSSDGSCDLNMEYALLTVRSLHWKDTALKQLKCGAQRDGR